MSMSMTYTRYTHKLEAIMRGRDGPYRKGHQENHGTLKKQSLTCMRRSVSSVVRSVRMISTNFIS